MSSVTPYCSGYLPETDGHSIFYACYGNREGPSVLFLHGGPGCGFEEGYLPLFDLSKVNLVTFDQRGAGLSKPTGMMEQNTTKDLINDIEHLRFHLKIDKWVVVGHSWGTTLGVVYAQAYPKSCLYLVLAAYFGAKFEDQNWTFSGAQKFFPNEVNNLHSLQKLEDAHLSLDEWIFKNLSSTDQMLSRETAYRLLCLEEAGSKYAETKVTFDDATDNVVNIYKILFFYAKHKFFIDSARLYNEALTVKTILVHGQFDMDCTPDQAYRLKSSFPNIDLRIIRGGNHSVFESPMFGDFKEAISDALRESCLINDK